jgi:succinoglycan biosynthesis transport protein ExoP
LDNFKDKFKKNANSAGENHVSHSDPIIQARDYSRNHHGIQHTEIINRTKGPLSITDARFLPSQTMGIGELSQPPFSVNNILKIMSRFKWTILAIFMLVAAPAIAAIWTQIKPVYSARAELRIRPIIPHIVFRTEDNGMIPLYDSFINTQVSIIKSTRVLQRVLDQKEVQETQWYRSPKKTLKQRLLGHPITPHIERLRNTLSVRPRFRTEIMDLSFTDNKSNDAKIIMNAILRQYMIYIGERTDEDRDIIYKKIVDQYTNLENDIKGREATISALRNSLGTGTPDELISNMRLRMDDTQARQNKLKTDIELLEWELTHADANDSSDIPDAPILATEKQKKYYEDQEWRQLDRNIRTIQHQIATSLLTTKHPDRAKMEMDLNFAEELLRIREAQLDEQWLEQQANSTYNQKTNKTIVPIIITNNGASGYEKSSNSLEFQLARLKEEEQLLNTELEEQKEEFKVRFAEAQSLKIENNELQHKRDLFEAVRARLDQKNMESNVSGRIELLTEAFVSSMPNKDRRIVYTGMVLALAGCMGCGMAFLKTFINQKMYTKKDLPYPMQVPFLGYIPTNRTRRSSDMEFSPAVIESIRIVRTALLSRLNGRNNSTVLITSAGESTGKTTFTTILGKSLAQTGKKVLMIDADFRKITLTKRFNLIDKPGFLESLSSRTINKEHIFPTETFGLSIIPAGKRSNEDVVFEETANGAFKACISQLQKRYNIILVDSSPILPVADALILSSQVDGTIMVEREHVSQRTNLINALERLDSAGGHLLGTIFVGSSNNEGYNYYYHYSKTSKS